VEEVLKLFKEDANPLNKEEPLVLVNLF